MDFDENISDLEKSQLLHWLGKQLGVRACPLYNTNDEMGRNCVDLKDEWSNGVLLSEMVAALNRDQKDLVKEVLLA